MFDNFKKEWKKLSQLDRILYSAIVVLTLAAFLLVSAGGQKLNYGMVCMGAAALMHAVKHWRIGKCFSIFTGLFGLLFLYVGIVNLF